MNPLILLPLIAIFAYFLMIRPAKSRQRQQQEMSNALTPGVEVRTIGGMLATVKAVDGDVVVLEPAPGVEVRYIRQAVAAITSPLNVADATDEADDTDADADEADDTAAADEVETEKKAGDETGDDAAEAKAEDEPATGSDTDEQDGAAKEAVAAGSAAKKA